MSDSDEDYGVVVPPPTSCACCGSDKLSKIGEDVTETLEAIPRRWKVIRNPPG